MAVLFKYKKCLATDQQSAPRVELIDVLTLVPFMAKYYIDRYGVMNEVDCVGTAMVWINTGVRYEVGNAASVRGTMAYTHRANYR